MVAHRPHELEEKMENTRNEKVTFTIELNNGDLKIFKDGVEVPQVAVFFSYMLKDGDVMVLAPQPPVHALAPVMASIFLRAPALLHLMFDFFLDLAHQDFERWRAEKLKQKKGTEGYGLYI